jgi:hypothetical protein
MKDSFMIEELVYGKKCSSLSKEGIYIGRVIPGRRARAYHCVLDRNSRALSSGEVVSAPRVMFFQEEFSFSKENPTIPTLGGYSFFRAVEVPKRHLDYANQLLDKYLPLKRK